MANFLAKLFKIDGIKVKAAEYVDAAVQFVEEASTSEKGVEKKRMAIDWILDKLHINGLVRLICANAISEVLDTLIEQAVVRLKKRIAEAEKA